MVPVSVYLVPSHLKSKLVLIYKIKIMNNADWPDKCRHIVLLWVSFLLCPAWYYKQCWQCPLCSHSPAVVLLHQWLSIFHYNLAHHYNIKITWYGQCSKYMSSATCSEQLMVLQKISVFRWFLEGKQSLLKCQLEIDLQSTLCTSNVLLQCAPHFPENTIVVIIAIHC